jgi:hypothetical protein
MGTKISDATPDDAVGGTEIVPIAEGASPRSCTTAQIKDYVIDQIEALAAAVAVDGADKLYILDNTDSALHPVDIDLVAQHAIDTIWAKAKEAAPVDADEMALKDDVGTEKTILLSVLAEYVRATIEAAILDISDLADGSGLLAAGDYMLVTQGTTGRYITFQDVIDGVYAGFDTYLTALAAVGTTADADVFYCLNGGVEKKVTLSQIVAHVGAPVTKTGSTTLNSIPQWTANDGELKDGLTLTTGSFDAGVSTAVATTESIRGEMDTIVNDATEIGAALEDADTFLVDDGDAGTTQRKSTFTRIWTWALAKIKSITDLTGHGWVVDEDTLVSNLDTKVPTQQSVKAYVDNRFNYKTIWVPASQMTPSVTNPAGTETHQYATEPTSHYVLLYDGLAQDEHAEFNIIMPESWDLGTIKYKVYWTNGDVLANAGEYVSFYLAATAHSNDDTLEAALGTAVTVEGQHIADDDMQVTIASEALTIGGTPILGDMVHFRLSRDFDYAGAGVAMDVDARVFGVLIQYKEDQTVTAW